MASDITMEDRGRQILDLFDKTVSRLGKELGDDSKELKASTINAALDLFRFVQLDPRQVVAHVPKGDTDNQVKARFGRLMKIAATPEVLPALLEPFAS